MKRQTALRLVDARTLDRQQWLESETASDPSIEPADADGSRLARRLASRVVRTS
jgi:hypothetical protein